MGARTGGVSTAGRGRCRGRCRDGGRGRGEDRNIQSDMIVDDERRLKRVHMLVSKRVYLCMCVSIASVEK